ncbi:hypothetical protein T09_1699 [Trichinella sp. T9]|nr:hypothetical protein T09_1699 [Trichinella sp. T9]
MHKQLSDITSMVKYYYKYCIRQKCKLTKNHIHNVNCYGHCVILNMTLKSEFAILSLFLIIDMLPYGNNGPEGL